MRTCEDEDHGDDTQNELFSVTDLVFAGEGFLEDDRFVAQQATKRHRDLTGYDLGGEG